MLLPAEFYLNRKSSSDSPFVTRLLEEKVTVTSATFIEKGHKFHPLEGTVRWGKLDVFSTLDKNDVNIIYFLYIFLFSYYFCLLDFFCFE